MEKNMVQAYLCGMMEEYTLVNLLKIRWMEKVFVPFKMETSMMANGLIINEAVREP